MRIIVKEGCSVMSPQGGYVLGPGTDLLDHMSAEKAWACVDSGFAVQEGSVFLPPGKVVVTKPATTGLVSELKPSGDTPAPGSKAKSSVKWGMDPMGLVDLPLDQLNLLVKERDENMEPFTTVEEAIAQLSMEFVVPGTPLAPPQP